MKKLVMLLLAVGMLATMFGCHNLVTRRTDADFTIEIPTDWYIDTSTEVATTEEGAAFLYVIAPTEEMNFSYFYGTYLDRSYIDDLDSINDTFGEAWAENLTASLGVTISYETMSLTDYGAREGITLSFSGEYQGIDLVYYVQLIPTDDKWYIFTYYIYDGDHKKEMKDVMDSLAFF